MLSAALIELTSRRPYASIQVRDITEQADVGYATFYRHYGSKDDLMLEVIDEITEDLESSASDQGKDYFVQEGIFLFRHVQKYQGFYRNIIQNQAFLKKLKRLLSRRILAQITRHSGSLEEPALPVDLAAHHIVVALIGLIEWWLDNKLNLPLEEMARIYKRLVIQATLAALDQQSSIGTVDHF